MSVLAAISLAAALAAGGTTVGCGGGGSDNQNGSSSGTDSGPDTGSSSGTVDSGKDTGVDSSSSSGGDSGQDSSSSSSGADTGPTCTTTLQSPTFTPPDGTAFTGSGQVTINPPAGFPAGGTIFFTTNGTIPNHNSSVYIGPIQVTASETIFAIATNAGDCDSPAVHASYTVSPPEAGPVSDPVFNPTSQSQNNDFLVSLSTNPGDTICYRLDGNTPTCSNGACTGGSQTYNGASQVSINGSVTDATTGKVTVTAIACSASGAQSNVVSQVYQLIVADPTMINPQPAANIPWVTGGLKPTVSTATVTSNETSSIWFTTSGAAPTCITGTQAANPTTFGGAAAGSPPALTTNTTIQAIGCKQGYLHSNVVPFAYTIQLNAPKLLASGTYHFAPSIWTSTATADNGINDLANAGAGDLLCGSKTGDPVCGTNGAGAPTCTTGTSPLTTRANSLAIGNGTSATTTVKVIACAPAGLNSSAAGTGTYTLQYAPAYVYTSQNLVAPLANLPGWDWAGAGTANTSMAIPSAATFPYPYNGGGSFRADIVQPLTCTGTAGSGIQGGALPLGNCTANSPVNPAGATANTAADFYCFSTTGSATCGCDAAHKTGAGGDVALAAAAGVNVSPGTNTLSIIPCQNPTPTTVFASPASTDVKFSSPNNVLAPTIQAQANPPGTSQATVTITNNDPTGGGSFICATFGTGGGNVPADPSCGANGKCTTGSWCWGGAAAGWVQSTANGSNCVVTPAQGQTGNTVTISPGPTGGAVGSPTGPGLVQTDGEVIKAIACNSQLQPSTGAAPQTYKFSGAEPDFTSAAGAAATPPKTGDLNTATSIGAGAVVNLSSSSNFDVPGAAQNMEIHWTTTGTATCGSANVVTVTSVTKVGSNVISTWPTGGANPVAPSTGSSWTVSAVTCGQNDGVLQAISAPRTVTFALAAAQPVITTNQFTGTTVGTCNSAAATTCTPQPIWENAFHAYVSSTTPGASICWSTTGAPSCTNGTCGNGSTQVTSGTDLGLISASNTNVQVLGCSPGLPASAPANYQVTLNDTKAVAGGSTPTCGNTTTVALATTDAALGGPTQHACVCYTTDGSTPACVASTCASSGKTTCFDSGAAGTTPSAGIPIAGTTTINTTVCKQGFNPTSGSQSYSVNPYVHTITVDGNISEWNTGAFAGDEAVAVVNNNWGGSPAATGYFTYDANTAYVGVNLAVNSAADYYLGVYLGSAGATGANKELPPLALELGGVTRSMDPGLGITNAFIWQTNNATAPGTYAWNSSTLVWSPQTFTVNVGYDSGTNTVEFGIPLSGIGTPPVITMFASYIQNVGYGEQPNCDFFNNTGGFGASGFACTVEDFEMYRFPYQGHGTTIQYADSFQDTRSSCLPPNAQFH